jgi:hypothetical protein
MPPRWVLMSLLCAALVIRGQFMLHRQGSLVDDPDFYLRIGSNLYEAGTFGIHPSSPTTYRPPLYPCVLAALGWLLPNQMPIGLLHVVLGVGTVWAVWRLGLQWQLPPGAALVAAGLVTVDPILLNQSVLIMTETLAAFLAAWTLVALGAASNRDSLVRASLAGAMLGLCVLCRPTFMTWLGLLAIAWPFMVKPRRVVRTAALLLAAVVVLAPWTIRNAITFGRPIVTTTHGGYTLLLANNPYFYRHLRSAPWGTVWRNSNVYLYGDSPRNLDEFADDRLAYELALRNIAAEPGMFAYSCLVRVGRLWGVLPHQLDAGESPSRRGERYAVAIWYLLELALAVVGLWALGRRAWSSPWIWGTLLLVSFTAVHSVYWTDLRMRAPLMSVVAVLAAGGVMHLARRKHDAKPLAAAA